MAMGWLVCYTRISSETQFYISPLNSPKMKPPSKAPLLQRKGIYLWPKPSKYLQHISNHDLPPNAILQFLLRTIEYILLQENPRNIFQK
jgi:hypothetical protein